MTRDLEQSGAALLHERLASIPALLRRVVASPAPAIAPIDGPVVATGVGASEGPARTLVWLASRAGRWPARFVPLSSFYDGARAFRHETLVVFSQQLSPNARMALATASRFCRSVLFTSATPPPAGVEAVVLPPDREEGTLLRIAGPLVASFAAMRWVLGPSEPEPERFEALVAAIASAEARVREALDRAPADALSRPVAFVTSGDGLDAHRSLATKWLEGTCRREPPVWDVLSVAHGPFHQLAGEPTTFVTLEHAGSAAAELFDRLERMVAIHGHAVVRLSSALPVELAVLDHDALVDALVVRAQELAPCDLGYPHTRGLDAPLYGIDAPRGGAFGREAS